MTDNELKKLKRRELLEILYYMRKELDETRLENEQLREHVDKLNKDHKEIMFELNKASKQIDRLYRAKFNENKKPDNGIGSAKENKSQNKRKQKRGSEKSGK